jgi:hypothetical protein
VTGDQASGYDPGGQGLDPQTVTFERVDGAWFMASAG